MKSRFWSVAALRVLCLVAGGVLCVGQLHAGSIWSGSAIETVWGVTSTVDGEAASSAQPSPQGQQSKKTDSGTAESETGGQEGGNTTTETTAETTAETAAEGSVAGSGRQAAAPGATGEAAATSKSSPGSTSPGSGAAGSGTAKENHPAATENFIVQAASMEVALHAVEQVGGKITHRLGIIDAVAADLTASQVQSLQESEGVKLHANRKVSIER